MAPNMAPVARISRAHRSQCSLCSNTAPFTPNAIIAAVPYSLAYAAAPFPLAYAAAPFAPYAYAATPYALAYVVTHTLAYVSAAAPLLLMPLLLLLVPWPMLLSLHFTMLLLLQLLLVSTYKHY